jgi:Zn-dependent protease
LGPEDKAVFRDDAAPSRSQRLLNASWPLFRAFGVDVRAHWVIVLVPVVLFWQFVKAFSEIQTLKGVPTEAQPNLHWQEAAAWALVWTLALYLTVWLHELAHALVARRFGVGTRLISLSPFGGLAHPSAPTSDPRAEFWTAFAGPATQFALAALLCAPWFAFDVDALAAEATKAGATGFDRWPQMFGPLILLQLVIGAFNLLPIHPLDGGRCLRAAFLFRMAPPAAARWTTYVGYPGAIMLSVGGAWTLILHRPVEAHTTLLGIMLVAVGMTCFLHCRGLQLEAQETESVRAPAEAWTSGRAPEPWKGTIAESERLSRAEERRERRAAEARRQEELERRKVQERIDQLLDRINEVGGVENLTPSERRELAEASELLRRETAEN